MSDLEKEFEEKYKNNQLSSFERKLFEAYYPYKERCETLEAKIEVLTKCFEPTYCPNWEDFNKCQGCQNKKLLEEVKSE